jgi:hypothetical protein
MMMYTRLSTPNSVMNFQITLSVVLVVMAKAILPPQNPLWPPSYSVQESIITMQCNRLGSPSRGAKFGIVSHDWSDAKRFWAAAKPMTCEELFVKQAESTKAAGARHVFVYRNIVEALTWFKTVREKLDDPAYEASFSNLMASNHSVPFIP